MSADKNELKIVAVGGAPSTGSTFLADILDSAPFAVCGPELNLLSVRGHYTKFEVIKRRGWIRSMTGSPRFTALRLNVSDLSAYGLTERQVDDMVSRSESFGRFCRDLFSSFGRHRHKDVILGIEKTPANIHSAGLFLDEFPDGWFIQIVRDPLFVTKSIRARGVPEAIARSVWLIDTAAGAQFRDHPRFITVRYEDLVTQPFETVAELFRQIGETIEPAELEKCYRTNAYRRDVAVSIGSWQFSEVGTPANANQKPVTTADRLALADQSRTAVSPDYARRHQMEACTFADLAHIHRYSIDAAEGLPARRPPLAYGVVRRRVRRLAAGLILEPRAPHPLAELRPLVRSRSS